MQIPSYPKIPGYDRSTPDKPCVVFEKYDGTCLSWHWNRKLGFQNFYTRRRSFDHTDPDFGESVEIFISYAKQLEATYSLYPSASDIVIYAEFFGKQSFAGLHNSNDQKELKFLDAWISDLGFLEPKEFTRNFRTLPLAREIYRGKLNGKIVEAIKQGKYSLNEGAVCKGGSNGNVWTCKIKTAAWLQKLQDSFTNKPWIAADEISRDLKEELDS